MTTRRRTSSLSSAILTVLTVLLTACGGGSSGSAGPGAGTDRARFVYEVDLQGVTAELVMDVEVVGNTGVTWGPGVTPDITGVVSSGSSTLYTSGQLVSPVAAYVFTGENAFADFTETRTFERFRVRWDTVPGGGLRMVVNPFGPGPVVYDCRLVSATPL